MVFSILFAWQTRRDNGMDVTDVVANVVQRLWFAAAFNFPKKVCKP
jgi:hypothetical protein